MKDILTAIGIMFAIIMALGMFFFMLWVILAMANPANAWQTTTTWGSISPWNKSPWQNGQPVQVHSYDWSTGNRTNSTIYKHGNRYNINTYDFNTGWKQKTCYQNGNQMNCYGY